MENQLEMEKMKVETGKKKIALLHDQLHEKVNCAVGDVSFVDDCRKIVHTDSC